MTDIDRQFSTPKPSVPVSDLFPASTELLQRAESLTSVSPELLGAIIPTLEELGHFSDIDRSEHTNVVDSISMVPVSRMRNRVQRVVEGSLISLEASPAGGVLRYGAYAAVLAKTGNIPAAVATLAGSTFVLEGMASAAMINVLERGDNKVIDTANRVADKLVRRDRKVTPLAQIVITDVLGVPVLLAAKQREDATRTREQNTKLGVKATSLLSGAIALQGTLIAEGYANITEPKVVAPAGAALAVLVFGAKKLKDRLARQNNPEVI